MHLKKLCSLSFVLALYFSTFAQASWHTRLAFTLQNEDGAPIDLAQFQEYYLLLNVSGDTLSKEQLLSYLTYDEESHYFILNIESIGPRFSFSIIQNDPLMAIYLPFVHDDTYYAIDLKFNPGQYLLDFDKKGKEKIFLNSNIPFLVIEKINWRKQRKRLLKSNYSSDQTYLTFSK